MSTKRVRPDGQISKEEYDDQQQQQSNSSSLTFVRASENDVSNRRMVAPNKSSNKKKQELALHLQCLNKSFSDWFHHQIKNDESSNCVDAVQDYIEYVTQLEDRFLRIYGEVMAITTVGLNPNQTYLLYNLHFFSC